MLNHKKFDLVAVYSNFNIKLLDLRTIVSQEATKHG